MDKATILDMLGLVVGGTTLGYVLKIMYNHLEHIKDDLAELRQMFVAHLQNHGKDK
jgi:hypothetical protein